MKLLKCPSCQATIAPPPMASGPQAVACPDCRTILEIEVFPALFRAPAAGVSGQVAGEGDAVCYVHVERRAERACDQCGRFMCALCDLEVGAMHLCPACFESGRRRRNLAQVERGRIVFPAIAARLVAASLFVGPFAPILCVPAIGMSVWGLIKPTSITGSRYAGTAGISILGGVLLTILWSAFWLGVATAE